MLPARERQALVILSDGAFHSGEELAERFGGVTRAAVWKIIQALQQRGIQIYAVRGRGYRLAESLELLDRQQIALQLSSEVRHRVAGIEVYACLDSTNSYLMQRANNGLASGSACFAEAQSAGRGRRGRQWVSPFAANLYFSLLWRFAASPPGLMGLSLVIGVAIARALERLGVQSLGVKWPNDILWERRKLGGILLEFGGESSGPCHVVAGVGINVAMSTQAGHAIDQAWVDLRSILGAAPLSRNQLAGLLLNELVTACQQFECWGFKAFRDTWQRLDLTFGQPIILKLPHKTLTGIGRGIDESGYLLVETETGLERFTTGEVSLRFAQ
jgi:BirA family biotin operon repressor/biotin-[acetyl-CoA-carboxylase] ligase